MRKQRQDQVLDKPDKRKSTSQEMISLTDTFVVPANIDKSIAEMSIDLAQVPVLGSDGKRTNIFKKIEAESSLDAQDKRLIWTCLAIVHNAFKKLDQNLASEEEGKGYQLNANWKHTRAELDQVLEAAKLLNLTGPETRDAIIASIFSDSVKTRGNFIVHNIHGAEAAAHVLSQLLKLTTEEDNQTLERVVRAVREHQIAPPEFMARAVAITLYNKLNLGHFEVNRNQDDSLKDRHSESKRTIAEIFEKIKDPFRREHVSEDLTRIAFTGKEKSLLKQIGIEDWWVPHPSRIDSLIAQAVIAGDHSINYNHPEGFAKIALIRGPETESIFEDATIHQSLLSALHSFADSFRVIRPEVQTLAMDGLRRTMSALERVHAVMSQLFRERALSKTAVSSYKDHVLAAFARAQNENPALFLTDDGSVCKTDTEKLAETVNRVATILKDWSNEFGEIPFNPNPDAPARLLPFWNTPLTYPSRNEQGQAQLDQLTELQLRQYKFALRIRSIAVELLRAEQWALSASP